MASYGWLKMMVNLKKSPSSGGYVPGLNFIAQVILHIEKESMLLN